MLQELDSTKNEAPPRSAGEVPPTESAAISAPRLVFRNALRLVITQVAGMPLSLATTAVMARRVGSEGFGLYYLATTFSTFGFLAVDWGQAGVVPAIVARDRTQAGQILGTTFHWRIVAALVVYTLLAAACLLLGYQSKFLVVLGLVVLTDMFNSLAMAHADIFRGFERTDIIGYSLLAGEFGRAVLVIPALLLGFGLFGMQVAEVTCGAIVLAIVWRVVRRELGQISFRFDQLKTLLVQGAPFLLFALAIALQPSIDGAFLSKLASPESVGWYAAARKLMGVLVLPANGLVVALYPTLCRLHVRSMDEFRRTTSSALRLTMVLVVPVALGCAIYPSIGIGIFSKEKFGPAANDLRILSLFLLFVFFTMPLGSAALAAGKQRIWATIQLCCVVMSAGLDFTLIPYFQSHLGNGGLGSCITSVTSEGVMLIAGISLLPRGTLDRTVARQLGLTLVAAAVMAGTAYLTSGLNAFVSAPLAVVAYLGCLVATGAIDKDQARTFGTLFRMKAST